MLCVGPKPISGIFNHLKESELLRVIHWGVIFNEIKRSYSITLFNLLDRKLQLGEFIKSIRGKNEASSNSR